MVKFDIKPSLHTLPIDLRDLDCRWGKICGVLDAWVKRGFRFSSALCMACMILPSGRMTWGVLIIVCLLLHGMFTLI